MHVWYVDAGIEDTPEPVYTHCLVLGTSLYYSRRLKLLQMYFNLIE